MINSCKNTKQSKVKSWYPIKRVLKLISSFWVKHVGPSQLKKSKLSFLNLSGTFKMISKPIIRADNRVNVYPGVFRWVLVSFKLNFLRVIANYLMFHVLRVYYCCALISNNILLTSNYKIWLAYHRLNSIVNLYRLPYLNIKS